MPKMNYGRLLGRMRAKGYTQETLAKAIPMSAGHLNRKLNGDYQFKQFEIKRICELLEIDSTEIGDFFFCPMS